jgi:hypothetical protein
MIESFCIIIKCKGLKKIDNVLNEDHFKMLGFF